MYLKRIYAIRNMINDRLYIGQTSQTLNQRIQKHFKALEKGSHSSELFIKDYKEYGKQAFEIIEIETIEINDFLLLNDDYEFLIPEILVNTTADIRECYYIRFFNTINKGYNKDSGGNIGKLLSNNTREKIRIYNTGMNHPNYGKQLKDETKKKISKAKKGILCSETTKQKISNATTGIKKGPMNENTKRKLSEANRGKKMSEETKSKLSDIHTPILEFDFVNEVLNLLSKKTSIRQISKILCCQRSLVNRIKEGKYKLKS